MIINLNQLAPAAARVVANLIGAPRMAMVITNGAISHAWFCPSEESALHTLRQWYAAQRAIFYLDAATGLPLADADSVEDLASTPDPATASLRQIEAWHRGDESDNLVLICPLTTQEPLPLVINGSPTMQDIAPELWFTASQTVTAAVEAVGSI